jgi:hypothetical protein
VQWKRDEIVRLFGIRNPTIYTRPNGQGKKFEFTFTAGRRFRIISQWFRKDGHKYISPKIRFMDHPVGLAVLLCDDGSVRRRKKFHKDGSIYYLKPCITIATHCFSKEEVQRFLLHLSQNFGVVGVINPERRWRKGEIQEYCRTHFNCENSRKLWALAGPFIPKVPSMNAKFAFAREHFETNQQAPEVNSTR